MTAAETGMDPDTFEQFHEQPGRVAVLVAIDLRRVLVQPHPQRLRGVGIVTAQEADAPPCAGGDQQCRQDEPGGACAHRRDPRKTAAG